jgi:hypothetical protein
MQQGIKALPFPVVSMPGITFPEARLKAQEILKKHGFPEESKQALLLSSTVIACSPKHVDKAFELRQALEPKYERSIGKINEVVFHARALFHLSEEVGDGKAHDYADAAARIVSELKLKPLQTKFVDALNAVKEKHGDYNAAKRLLEEAQK